MNESIYLKEDGSRIKMRKEMSEKWENTQDRWLAITNLHLVRMYTEKVNCTVSSVIVTVVSMKRKNKQHNSSVAYTFERANGCRRFLQSLEYRVSSARDSNADPIIPYIRLKSHKICYSDSVRNWTWTNSVVIERWSATYYKR